MYSFGEFKKWDLIEKIRPLLHPNGAYWLRSPPGKIEIPKELVQLDVDQSWLHIMQLPDRYCKIYSEVFVGCLKMLPERCLHCWKVVFRPQYLKDMFNLIPVMRKLADEKGYPCKLGPEIRPWTTGVYGRWGLWGAYFYNNTQEIGIQCWEDVKNAIASSNELKHLLDDVDADGYPLRLVLKRGCTEFEIANFGDSKYWKQTEEQKEWEKIVWRTFEKQIFSTRQTDELQHHMKTKWFIHAHKAGDPTVIELNGGRPLYPTTRFYHKELFEKVKKKRALKKALKKK